MMNISDLCHGLCCPCCFECCCPQSKEGDIEAKRPLLHYYSLQEDDSEFEDGGLHIPQLLHSPTSVPMSSIAYSYPQVERQVYIHPQIETQIEAETHAKIISRQPKRSRHTSSSGHSSASKETRDSPDVQSLEYIHMYMSHHEPRATGMKTLDVSDESILQISLYYDRYQCFLIVHLYRAFNIPTKCKSEASNCFVTLYLLPKKKQIYNSIVIPGTLHPKFDQVFKFAKLAPGEVHQQSLVFCIHNSHGGKDDFVGQALLSLESSNFDGESIKISIAEVQLDEQAKVQNDA